MNVEINIKRYENGELTSNSNRDVEHTDLYSFMYYELRCFLKKSDRVHYKETHYNLHYGKRDLLITFEHSFFRSRMWYFIFNGIGYSYAYKLKGLKNAIVMFLNFVKQDANIKENYHGNQRKLKRT